VTLSAPAGCPRYLGRVIRGVDLSRPSPRWLVEKLRRSGLRSIDPVVDVTNFVLLELGQPMHAFDLARLRGGIVVRMAHPGEKLTLLDGQQVSLDAETLLIADADGPVAIAGVMGASGSGGQSDDPSTCSSSAPSLRRWPLPARRAATACTPTPRTATSAASTSELQHQAMERATALLLDIVGGEPGPGNRTVAPEHLPPARVRLRERRLRALLGVSIDPADVDQALAVGSTSGCRSAAGR
jgi:phenylalanyl-tRNA synthetase beta chain